MTISRVFIRPSHSEQTVTSTTKTRARRFAPLHILDPSRASIRPHLVTRFGPRDLRQEAYARPAVLRSADQVVYRRAVGDDLDLLDAWRAGDKSAGDTLISRYFESICRFFRGKLGDDVEDLVQRTFEIGTARRTTIRPGGSFRGFLFGVARNLLLDHLRRRYRRGVREDISVRSLVDLGTSPSEAVHRDERQALLAEAMRHISIDQQIILELAYWEGLSGREIAEVLEIHEHTVRSRLARARKALRAQVVALGGPTDATLLGDPSGS